MKNKSAFFLLLAVLFLVVVLVFAFFYTKKNPELLQKLGISQVPVVNNVVEKEKPTVTEVSKVLENSQSGKQVTEKELTDLQKLLEQSNKTVVKASSTVKSGTSTPSSTNTIQAALSDDAAAKQRADLNKILSGGN